jgi:class 3 adenylate cyclase/tetratricopeptide (TPR) repeat protein
MSNTATVTILFTDVVGSVELRTKRGDESAHKLMEKHFDLVRQQIEHHSGQEVKTMGDGFMVAFGSAHSAVNCAVDLQQALAEHNFKNPDEQVQVRIGLNTGEAIKKKGDLFGTAVDAGARIMSKAAGGQILIPENTRKAIGTVANVELLDRGPFWLKGFTERWRLYEILWHEDNISTAAVLPHIGRQTPFVGRESERAELRRLMDAARSGHGSLVMIGGEPGAGKTRIAQELVAEADRHGFLTLTGHCYEMEGAPPYIPFVEILQSIIRTVEPHMLLDALGSAAPEAAKLVPELRERATKIPEPRKLAPEQERLYLFNTLRDFFERLASQRPVLLTFEDLHWADESTMLLLQHIAQKSGEMALLVVGTYRDTELDVARSLAKALEEMLRQRLAYDIVLRRLSEADVAAMLRGHSEHEPPTRLVELVYRETEGNPFFVEEIFKHFTEEEKLFDAKGGWRSELEIDEAEVPRGIRLVIGRRLERMSEECRRMLTAAAIIGRSFSFDLLDELANLDEDSLYDSIEAAERAQLIRSKRERGKARFIFSHELIRQTLVSSLSLPRRQRAHLRVAETVERLSADALEEHAADLAYHFYQGDGDSEKIVTYSAMAAERATSQTAYGEAVEQYQRALQALEQERPVDELRRCNVLLALGHAHASAGDPSRAKETFRQILQFARKLKAPEQFAEATLGLCRFWLSGNVLDAELLAMMDEALTHLSEEDSALRAALLARLACVSEQLGDERRLALSEQALAMARRVGDAKALWYALWSGIWNQWTRSLEQRISLATELMELEEREGSPEGVTLGPAFLCHVHLVGSDIAAFDDTLGILKSRATETAHPRTMWIVKIIESAIAVMRGRFEEAESLASECLALGQKVDKVNAGEHFGAIRYAVRHLQGRLVELDEDYRKRTERFSDVPSYIAHIAHLHLVIEREQETRKEYERLASDNFAGVGKGAGMLGTMMHLSEVATAFGDVRRAATLYDMLHPYADCLIVFGLYTLCCGSASHWLGLLAATLKRWNDSILHFEHSIEINTRIGARPFLARSQHEYARMLIERNESGDRDKARIFLTEATATYRELGMPTFLENAEELLAKL